MAYLFLFFGQTSAGMFALSQGFLIDLFSGGFNGLHTLLYIFILGGLQVATLFINLYHPTSQIVLVFMAVLIKKILFVIILMVFSKEIVFATSFFWISVTSAILTGLLSPIVFYFLDLLRDSLKETLDSLEA